VGVEGSWRIKAVLAARRKRRRWSAVSCMTISGASGKALNPAGLSHMRKVPTR
jgi:hypothetical protein